MAIITIAFDYDTLEAEKIVKRQGEDPRHVVVDPPVMTQTLLAWLREEIDEYWFPGLRIKDGQYHEE